MREHFGRFRDRYRCVSTLLDAIVGALSFSYVDTEQKRLRCDALFRDGPEACDEAPRLGEELRLEVPGVEEPALRDLKKHGDRVSVTKTH